MSLPWPPARRSRPASCATVRAAISAAADGEATGLRAGEVEAHCAGCAGCRRLAPALAQVATWRELAAVPHPPETLVAALGRLQVESVGRRPVRGRRLGPAARRPLAWAAAAAPAAFAAVALPLGLGTSPLPPASHPPSACTVGLHHPGTAPSALGR